MSNAHDDYKRLEIPDKVTLQVCPVCGSAAELWQYSEANDGPTSKLVMCSMGDAFGPQDGLTNEGCLLYMPPNQFYRGRIAEAVKYWNDYATALNKIRRANNWKTAQVLREVKP